MSILIISLESFSYVIYRMITKQNCFFYLGKAHSLKPLSRIHLIPKKVHLKSIIHKEKIMLELEKAF